MILYICNSKTNIMIDTYNDNNFNSNNPDNMDELEKLTELEDALEYNFELKNKIEKFRKTLKRYFELLTFPINLTSDEMQEVRDLENKLKNM